VGDQEPQDRVARLRDPEPHPEELARERVAVAELVIEDEDDPNTPSGFDWPAHEIRVVPDGR
jgi:hypothetical protein